MDACSESSVHKIVLIFASQMGKSECLLNVAGYFIDQDPATMLLIQPTLEDARDFSRDRFAPMISECPRLTAKVAEAKSRDSSNTTLRKEYPGGFAGLVGANAPSRLASKAIRVLLPDEVDRFPVSSGDEGDPLSIAAKRQTTYWNWLTYMSSTPTTKGESRIEEEYEDSTQEQWCVPCPSCGELQPYDWKRLDRSTLEMHCCFCGACHGELEWKDGEGQWIARQEHKDTRGFHINALASPFLTWIELADEWKAANQKGPEVLKTFINTRLAESWEERGEAAEEDVLETRRQHYYCDVPIGAKILTAGADVQLDRIECEVVAWGAGGESWGVQYVVFPGDPHERHVWQDVDEFLQGTYIREDGTVMPISCTCIDSQYATSEVHAFCKPRMSRYIFCIRGEGGPGKAEVGPYRKAGKNRDVAVFPVGTDASKDLFMSRLQVESEGPGYCHWPIDTELEDGSLRGYVPEYFKGLTAEKRVPRRTGGRVYHIWVKKASHLRNESLDCRVYASAALRIINPRWDRLGGTQGRKHETQSGVVSAGNGQGRRGRRVISRGVAV
jgi:phage terminase large subunit GpA-like protein